MKKIALLTLVVLVVITSSCNKIKQKKQLKLEQNVLETMSKMPRKDTLLLGFVLGWNHEQVYGHIEKLKDNHILYRENLSNCFDLEINDIIKYKGHLFPKFSNNKLMGIEVFFEGNNLEPYLLVSYCYKNGFTGLLFENDDITDGYKWFYVGCNLKIEAYKSPVEEGMWLIVKAFNT